jgi:hypothetical protein
MARERSRQSAGSSIRAPRLGEGPQSQVRQAEALVRGRPSCDSHLGLHRRFRVRSEGGRGAVIPGVETSKRLLQSDGATS